MRERVDKGHGLERAGLFANGRHVFIQWGVRRARERM